MQISPETARRIELWKGSLVGFAFRVFACGILWFVFTASFDNPRIKSTKLTAFVEVAWWIHVLSSLFLPLVAGFLSAYFWKHLQMREYMKGIYTSVFFFYLVVTAVLVEDSNAESLFFLMLLIPMDLMICLAGAGWGSEFWQSRLGRQFFGDFSTRDEEVSLSPPRSFYE